jgi:2-polyprenyl-3-methyl-5-hydroxy-6-metoxy-1,4-benzoquinol methylase
MGSGRPPTNSALFNNHDLTHQVNSTSLHAEFRWTTAGPANGSSGEGLCNSIINTIKTLEGIQTICDLGCGNGFMAGRLSTLGYDVTGVDVSKSGLQIARQANPGVEFVESGIDANLTERLGDGGFDLVLSSDVIEHLYRPADLLEAASRILKPRGRLVITTPYHGYLKNLAIALTGKMDSHFSALHDGGHIKFFSVKTLTQLITTYAFTDIHFTFYGRAPLLWKNMICNARKAD